MTILVLLLAQENLGFDTTFSGRPNEFPFSVKVFGNKKVMDSKPEIQKNQEWTNSYKIYISMAYGMGVINFVQVINKPFIGEPNTCCTETYLVIGPFSSKQECKNVISYMETKFFRFLVLLQKPTQHATQKVYKFVPLQDFSKPWSDKELYAKYNLTKDEIDYIESMIRPMVNENE